MIIWLDKKIEKASELANYGDFSHYSELKSFWLKRIEDKEKANAG